MYVSIYSGYNPPRFVIDAAREALNRVDCNQYAPTKVRMYIFLMFDFEFFLYVYRWETCGGLKRVQLLLFC